MSTAVRDTSIAIKNILPPVPGHPHNAGDVLAPQDYSFFTARAAPPAAPFPVCVVPLDAVHTAPIPLDPATGAFLPLNGGCDGLISLSDTEFVGEPFPPQVRFAVRGDSIQVFERVAEPACLASPDILIYPEPDPEIESPPFPVPDPCAPCPAAPLPAPLHARPQTEPVRARRYKRRRAPRACKPRPAMDGGGHAARLGAARRELSDCGPSSLREEFERVP